MFPYRHEKKFPTYIEETAVLFEKIAVSAGMRGKQIILNPEDLAKYVGGKFVPLTKE